MSIKTVGRYRLVKQLGVGMFSKVMQAIDDTTGQTYAIKIMRKDSLQDMEMVRYARREAAVLRRLSHPNIVSFVEAMQSDTKLFLVMQIAPGNELLDVVADGPLHETLAKTYISQLLHAVSYLHTRGVVHRDLKPDNVLVDLVNQTLTIIDFGLVGLIRHDPVMTTACGSSYYSAPEVTYGNAHSYDGIKADAWTLGILSYILMTGAHPFVDNNGDLMTAMMRQGIVEYPDFLSRTAKHFISLLLSIDPAKRYSVAQASFHPWLTAKFAFTQTGSSDLAKHVHGLHAADSSPTRIVKNPTPFDTFSASNHSKSFFGRPHSGQNHRSSPILATRRRSSQKFNNGTFMWFRKNSSSRQREQQLDDDGESMAYSPKLSSRRSSIERAKGLLDGFRREGRFTFEIGRKPESPKSRISRRRQLSLTSRTKALWMRTSHTWVEQQQ